jgi:transcription initiation factor IIF auxiliary subunit
MNQMNNQNIERFIRDNRQDFDQSVPPPQIWEKLEKELGLPKQEEKKTAPVISLRKWYYAAAASVIVLLSAGLFYFQLNKEVTKVDNGTAYTKNTSDALVADIDPAYAKQINQFAALIETKNAELKAIEKDQPELYKQFATDINKLDSSYNVLHTQLLQNPNKEMLLEAMIQNLQMQLGLLNQQLDIIQKIKQTKTQRS